MKKRRWVSGMLVLGCAALFLGGGYARGDETWEQDLSTYQRPYIFSGSPSGGSLAQPLWSVDTRNKDLPIVAPIGEKDRIWTVASAVVKAYQVSNGRIVWEQSGSALQDLAQLGDQVYTINGSGLLTAYAAETGTIRWKKQVLNPEGGLLSAGEDGLFVSWSKGLLKIDPGSGQILWQVKKDQSFNGGRPLVMNDVVLQTYLEEGALTTGALYAFDLSTGKELWGERGISGPLARLGDTIYVENVHWMTVDASSAATMIALDLHTGKEMQTIVYPRPASRPYGGQEEFPKQKAIHDGFIYIDVDGAINRYPLGIDPKLITDGDLTVYGMGDWIAGPVQNRLVYQGEEYQLSSMPIDRMSSVSYQGVNNPVTYLKVFGRALFAGQLDGRIAVDDFLTGKNVFLAQTGARSYQSVQVLGNYLAVQADGRILVYSAPRVAALAAASAVPATTKPVMGKAKFVIDGAIIDLGADPVWVNNQLLVPFRAIFQALGAEVEYDEQSKEVQGKKGDKTVILTVNQNFGLMNGVPVGISPDPLLVEGKVYVPARSVSQILDCQVKWQYSAKTVEITSQN